MIILTDAPERRGNSFVSPEWLSREVAGWTRAFRAFRPPIVLTDAEPEPVATFEPRVGDTIVIRKPARFR